MIRSALIYLSTVGAGQAVSLLLLPVVTYYLTPAQFGEYTVVLALTTLVGRLGSSWIRVVVMRLYFDRVREENTRPLFWTAAALQATSMTVLLALGYSLLYLIGVRVGIGVYLAGSVSVIVSALYLVSIGLLRAGHRPLLFGAAEFTSASLRLGLTWLGLDLGYRTPAALFVLATGSVIAALVVAAFGIPRLLRGRGGPDRASAAELIRLGVPSIPHAVGSWVVALSDRPLLAHFAGLSAVGVYSVAYSVADRAISGLTAGLYMMAWPALLRVWSEDPSGTPRRISQYLGVFLALTTGPAVLLSLEREFLLAVLVSNDFVGAADVVPYVVAGAWLTGIASYLNRPLELSKRYGALSAITMTAAGLNFALNLILIPAVGALGAAMATTAASAALAVFSAVYAARVAPIAWPWRASAFTLAAAVAAALVSRLFASSLVSIPVFAGVYTLVVGLGWSEWRGVGLLPRTKSSAPEQINALEYGRPEG